jgi:hypothetical protein
MINGKIALLSRRHLFRHLRPGLYGFYQPRPKY